MEKLLLTVKEAAAVVGVSEDTLYRWISKGVNGKRLPTVNTGVTRIRRSTLERFLDSVEKAA